MFYRLNIQKIIIRILNIEMYPSQKPREERQLLAMQRAMEIQHDRANPLAGRGAVPSTGLSRYVGGGSVPSMGVSQMRGGLHTLYDHLEHPNKGYGKRGGALSQALIRDYAEDAPKNRNDIFTPNAETREDTIARMYGMNKATFSTDQRQIRAFGTYSDDVENMETPTPLMEGGLINKMRGGFLSGKYDGEGAVMKKPEMRKLLGQIMKSDPQRREDCREMMGRLKDKDAAHDVAAFIKHALENKPAHVERIMGSSKPKPTYPDLSAMTRELGHTHFLAEKHRQMYPNLIREVERKAIGATPRRAKPAPSSMASATPRSKDIAESADAMAARVFAKDPHLLREYLAETAHLRGKKEGKGRSDGRSARAAIVKKIMAERGVSMIEASKIVKQENLY